MGTTTKASPSPRATLAKHIAHKHATHQNKYEFQKKMWKKTHIKYFAMHNKPEMVACFRQQYDSLSTSNPMRLQTTPCPLFLACESCRAVDLVYIHALMRSCTVSVCDFCAGKEERNKIWQRNSTSTMTKTRNAKEAKKTYYMINLH